MKKGFVTLIFISFFSLSVFSQVTVNDPQGRSIILNNDGTWDYSNEKLEVGETIESTSGDYAVCFKSGAIITLKNVSLCAYFGPGGVPRMQYFKRGGEVVSFSPYLTGSNQKRLDDVIDAIFKL